MKKKDGFKEKTNTPDLMEDIKRIQGLIKIISKPEIMSKLLENNLHSARTIATIPRKSFVKTYAKILGSEENAKVVWVWANKFTAQSEIIKHVTLQLSYIVRYDDDKLSKKELKELVELLCTDKRLLRSFRMYFAMKEGKK